MAQVSGRPFLETLLKQLQRIRFQRVILAVGHAEADIQSHFGERFVEWTSSTPMKRRRWVPAGRCGMRPALVRSTSCLVMNGDSYTDVDLRKFVADSSQ